MLGYQRFQFILADASDFGYTRHLYVGRLRCDIRIEPAARSCNQFYRYLSFLHRWIFHHKGINRSLNRREVRCIGRSLVRSA